MKFKPTPPPYKLQVLVFALLQVHQVHYSRVFRLFLQQFPDKQRISVENSRHVEHLGTPFIRLGPLWPTHNPFSLTIHYFSSIWEFTLLCVCDLLWWQAYQLYTTWRGARNRSNPKCVKLLRAQDPVIPELLPRWQVLAPMAPAQPRYAGAREGQQGQLRAITSPPLLSHELELGLIFQLQLRSSVKQQASEATWNVKRCPPLLLTNDVSSANENKYQVPHLLLEPVSKINFVARWENSYSIGWCENCWFSDWLSSTWRLQKFGFWHLEFNGC